MSDIAFVLMSLGMAFGMAATVVATYLALIFVVSAIRGK